MDMVLPASWVGEKKSGESYFLYPSDLPKRKTTNLIDTCAKPNANWSRIKIKKIKHLGGMLNLSNHVFSPIF